MSDEESKISLVKSYIYILIKIHGRGGEASDKPPDTDTPRMIGPRLISLVQRKKVFSNAV